MAAQQFQQQQQQQEAVVVDDDKTTSSASCIMGDPKLFPPGFRFHPTDEELILYWLKRKMCRQSLKLDMIAETDVYKWDPQDLPDLSKLRTGDRQWFFFSPRDRKYPNGARSNRATMHGYWKATGRDRSISCNSRSVGVKKTLVYYIGRAPSGKRTNWVMHEYTLDEEELKRCPAQDYYALYKVYNKSGPGPKNGEQYGAPFREEDWADDDCVNFNGMVNQGNLIKEPEVACADETRANTQAQVQLDDLVEEFLNQFANEPALVPPIDVDYTYALNNLLGDEENGSALASHQSREVNLPHQSMLLHHRQQCNMQPSFDFTQSATTQLQLHGACDITTALNICEQDLGENFLEDFLEIDDLGTELNAQNFERPTEELTLDQIDQLPGFYNDATMGFHDIRQGEVGSSSQPCKQNYLGGGIPNMVSHLYANNCVNEAVNYPVQSYLNDADQMGLQRWTQQDQRVAALPPADANQAAVCEQNSGMLSNYGNPANPPTEATHGQSVAVDGGDSWFTSALWAFVDSIPTTPASASETALVNKAFERVTSFGRLNINSGKKDDSATAFRRSRSSKLGILAFSILGIFCAILWVLIGSSMKLLWGCISS